MTTVQEPPLESNSNPVPSAAVQSPLSLQAARNAVVRYFRHRLAAGPSLVAAFWQELGTPEQIGEPDITALYCFVRKDGQQYLMFEFVAGETLESLVRRLEPAQCEPAIPVCCQILDAFEVFARTDHPAAKRPAPEPLAPSDIQCGDFGIVRVSCSVLGKMHGTVLFRPDGSLASEALGECTARRMEVYPLLIAIYEKVIGEVPKGIALCPAPVNDLVISLLSGAGIAAKPLEARPTASPAVAVRTRHVPSPSEPLKPFLIALGSAALVFCGLFGTAGILAKRTAKPSTMTLPSFPPLFDPAETPQEKPARQAPKTESPAAPVATAPVDLSAPTVRVRNTPGPRLIRPAGLQYPQLAQNQRVSGIVRLQATIGEDGSVQRPRILSGHPLLLAGVADAVKQWVYQPAMVNGRPVPMTTEIEIDFDLKDKRP